MTDLSATPEIPDRLDAERWVDDLWALIRDKAHGIDGRDVVVLLREASIEVWEAGVDGRFAALGKGEGRITDNEAALFDIVWLSVFLAKLTKHKSTLPSVAPKMIFHGGRMNSQSASSVFVVDFSWSNPQEVALILVPSKRDNNE